MREERDATQSDATDRSEALRTLSEAETITVRTGLEPLMTVAELAKLAGQSTRTVSRRIADGTIPVARLGGRAIRITRSAAQDYLAGEAAREPTGRQPETYEEDLPMKGYRVRVREVVEYDVMLPAESPDDAKVIVETQNPELDGGSRIEDGTPHETISLQAIGVEPYPDLDE